MESTIAITPVEIILAVALMVASALLALLLARRSAPDTVAPHLAELRRTQAALAESQSARQAELAGRLTQFAEDSAKRDDLFRKSLDERLERVSHTVGQSLEATQARNTENLKALHERLALIDRAQKNIEQLSTEVSGLQSVLSNKQARGAFGEKQMQDLIESYLPPSSYTFQHTLSNGTRVDAVIHLPGDQGDVAIDSKFPMEAWRRLVEADSTDREVAAQRDFARDMDVHIKSIGSKYLIFGETHDVAMMFLPSEAIYAELHANFPQVVEKSFAAKVMIVSPTTFMATLHTMKAVMKDAAMREQAHIIQREVGTLAKDVARLDERTQKLQSHFNQASEDVRQILISTGKITSRADKIGELDVVDDNLPENVTKLRG